MASFTAAVNAEGNNGHEGTKSCPHRSYGSPLPTKELSCIRATITVVLLLGLIAPAGADAGKCEHKRCWKQVRQKRAAHWLKKHTRSHVVANSTAYCLGEASGGGSTAADGHHVYFGMVAQNSLPFGTRIRTDRPIFGKRWWTIHDRIGHGSEADFWLPNCGMANQFGRRNVGFRVMR